MIEKFYQRGRSTAHGTAVIPYTIEFFATAYDLHTQHQTVALICPAGRVSEASLQAWFTVTAYVVVLPVLQQLTCHSQLSPSWFS